MRAPDQALRLEERATSLPSGCAWAPRPAPFSAKHHAMLSTQRRPKYPRINRMMTTAPTSQINLFTFALPLSVVLREE